MARAVDRPVDTFTIGFEDRDGFDERPFARLVAERYGTAHHEEVVNPDAVELVETLVWHHDQPFGDASAVPTYLLGQITRREVTVALSGDGGDELFAGMSASPRRSRFASCAASRRRARHSASRVARSWCTAARFAARLLVLPDGYRAWLSYADEALRDSLLVTVLMTGRLRTTGVWDESADARPLDRLLNLNLRTYLVDDLLVKADRMSMAHGLEVRSPFLDTELVELALRLAPHTKVRGLALKRVLRSAVGDLLPKPIVNAASAVSASRWTGGFARTSRDTSTPRSACRTRASGVTSRGPAGCDAGRHASGRAAHGKALWMLLTLEVFLRRERW